MVKSIILKGKLSRTITAFPKPLPTTIKDALEEHVPLSISQLENIIQLVLMNATSGDENIKKLKL